MPKRPRPHQLETVSRRAFVASLPPAWIYRDVNPDYGLDGLIEIFTPSGQSTGEFFFVQLKATDKSRNAKSFRVVLPLKTYRYYRTLLLPVLIALFHAPTRRLYAKWISDPSPRNSISLSRTKATVLFNSRALWNQARFATVRRRLRQVSKAALLGERKARINRYYASKRRLRPWAKAQKLARRFQRFADGNTVVHPVFGRGVIQQASENYIFVQFDADPMLRKFIPGDFPEFSIVGDRPENRLPAGRVSKE